MYLKEIGEVNEHVVPCLLLTTRDVKTDSNDIESFATFCEFVLDGEGVHPCSSQADDIGEPKDVGYTLYPLACFGKLNAFVRKQRSEDCET